MHKAPHIWEVKMRDGKCLSPTLKGPATQTIAAHALRTARLGRGKFISSKSSSGVRDDGIRNPYWGSRRLVGAARTGTTRGR
jgi:hypothetical protein